MFHHKEQKDILEAFIKKCVTNVSMMQESSVTTVFTISSTATKNKDYLTPYTTPIRKTKYFNIAGCIVYTQAQALLVAQSIDGIVDVVIVDDEKKIPFQIEPEIDFLPEHLVNITKGDKKSISNVETGNLTSVCYEVINKSKMYKFKPNDITVDAAFGFLEQRFPILSGMKIAIIGAGNIGSKLALKCVEVGAEVTIHRSNHAKGESIVLALNHIKSPSVISNITYCDDIVKATFMSDIIIGTTDYSIIHWKHVAVAKKNVLLVDVGKGSFEKETIKKCLELNLDIVRTDVTAFLEGYIVALLKQDEIIQKYMGKTVKNGVTYVSGGLLGLYGDVIVDNYLQPKFVIGLADGQGDLIKELSQKQLELLEQIKKDFT